MENQLNEQYKELQDIIKRKQIFKSTGGHDDKLKITEFQMNTKDYHVYRKAIDLFYKFRWEGVEADDVGFRDFAKECAVEHINEVILLLESIPKLTVCEIEGQNCYGIIDFYQKVKNTIETI